MQNNYKPGNLNERPDLFENDSFLPSQYSDKLRSKEYSQTEMKLMHAVLQDALECYQKYAGSRDPRQRELFKEAESWINSRDEEWPLSYENVCEVLGLDANYLREGLIGYVRKLQTNHRPDKKTAKIQPLTERLSSQNYLED